MIFLAITGVLGEKGGGGSYVESCIEGVSDLLHTMNVGQTYVASSLILLLVFRLESQ